MKTPDTMKIYVNGTSVSINNDATLHSLLLQLKLANQAVAVEVNSDIVPRQLQPNHILQAGDYVEIVSLVGGG